MKPTIEKLSSTTSEEVASSSESLEKDIKVDTIAKDVSQSKFEQELVYEE